MKRVALVLALLIPSTSLASTKVLLFDDIGSEAAEFAWSYVLDGQVAFSASVNRPICSIEDCTDLHSTGALDGFRREARDVYYVGNGDAAPILCGKTGGFLSRPRFYDACRVSVEPERVCQAWYSAGDCVESVTRYRVYLRIDERQVASEDGAPRGHSEGF